MPLINSKTSKTKFPRRMYQVDKDESCKIKDKLCSYLINKRNSFIHQSIDQRQIVHADGIKTWCSRVYEFLKSLFYYFYYKKIISRNCDNCEGSDNPWELDLVSMDMRKKFQLQSMQSCKEYGHLHNVWYSVIIFIFVDHFRYLCIENVDL